MDPGTLDRRITLLRFTSVQDETGQPIESWSTLGPATISAAKRDVSDSERIASAEVAATITTRFVVRWDSAWSDLNPKDRVLFEGRTYDISAVKEIGRRDGLEISASARAD